MYGLILVSAICIYVLANKSEKDYKEEMKEQGFE